MALTLYGVWSWSAIYDGTWQVIGGIEDKCPCCHCSPWTGYCGHFDCGPCSAIRSIKKSTLDYYKKMREDREDD